MRRALWLGVVLAAGLALADEDDDDPPYAIFGVDKTRSHACTRDERVTIGGSSNTVTITGNCRAVIVGGAKMTVTVENTTRLEVSGIGSTVTQKGSCPSAVIGGIDNKVSLDRVGVIEVSGQRNEVKWSASADSKRRVKVNDSGLNNVVGPTKP